MRGGVGVGQQSIYKYGGIRTERLMLSNKTQDKFLKNPTTKTKKKKKQMKQMKQKTKKQIFCLSVKRKGLLVVWVVVMWTLGVKRFRQPFQTGNMSLVQNLVYVVVIRIGRFIKFWRIFFHYSLISCILLWVEQMAGCRMLLLGMQVGVSVIHNAWQSHRGCRLFLIVFGPSVCCGIYRPKLVVLLLLPPNIIRHV